MRYSNRQWLLKIYKGSCVWILTCVCSLLLASCSSNSIDINKIDFKNDFLAVTAPNTYTSRLGQGVMQLGGNAFDAMIAMAFMSSVTVPSRSGFDAGGLCVYRTQETSKPVYIDFSDVGNSSNLLTAMAKLHIAGASIKWDKLLDPAINTAKKGFVIDKLFIDDVTNARKRFSLAGFIADDFPLKLDSILSQPTLANTLVNYSYFSDEEIAKKASKLTDVDAYVRHIGFLRFATTDDGDSKKLLDLLFILNQDNFWTTIDDQKKPVIFAAIVNMLRGGYQLDRDDELSVSQLQKQLIDENFSVSPKSGSQATVEYLDEDASARFIALDNDGKFVACTFSMGAVYGEGDFIKDRGYFSRSSRLGNMAALMIEKINIDENFFLGGFISSKGERVNSDLMLTLLRLLFDEENPFDAVNNRRFYLDDADDLNVIYESGIAEEALTNLKKSGFTVTQSPAWAGIDLVFCPVGIPAKSLRGTIICVSQNDPRDFGNNLFRLTQ